MSFSLKVKNELSGIMPNARHCRISELAAFVLLAGVQTEGNLRIRAEGEFIIERFSTLYKKIFSETVTNCCISEKRGSKTGYALVLEANELDRLKLLLKLSDDFKPAESISSQQCCKRAFIRTAFMCCGSISDPEKDYHLEFVVSDEERAEFLRSIIAAFDIDAKIIHRKQFYVVYLKDGESIVDILNVMEAHVSLMELENIRIVKEMRNSINRRVNCEAANIEKTIMASGRQIEDINYLSDTIGLDALSEDLRATAILRVQYPEASLSELGGLHDRPVGRSGVNHRLQKLSDMAARLRAGKPVNEKTEE